MRFTDFKDVSHVLELLGAAYTDLGGSELLKEMDSIPASDPVSCAQAWFDHISDHLATKKGVHREDLVFWIAFAYYGKSAANPHYVMRITPDITTAFSNGEIDHNGDDIHINDKLSDFLAFKYELQLPTMPNHFDVNDNNQEKEVSPKKNHRSGLYANFYRDYLALHVDLKESTAGELDSKIFEGKRLLPHDYVWVQNNKNERTGVRKVQGKKVLTRQKIKDNWKNNKHNHKS